MLSQLAHIWRCLSAQSCPTKKLKSATILIFKKYLAVCVSRSSQALYGPASVPADVLTVVLYSQAAPALALGVLAPGGVVAPHGSHGGTQQQQGKEREGSHGFPRFSFFKIGLLVGSILLPRSAVDLYTRFMKSKGVFVGFKLLHVNFDCQISVHK